MIFRNLVLCVALFAASPVPAETIPQEAYNNIITENRAFRPGERLSYTISWSGFLTAGRAVMEVKAAKTAEGRDVYHLVSRARSAGIVSTFYTVSDTVLSIVDAAGLDSLYYGLDQSHGRRKKQRQMFFDQEKRSIKVVSNGVAAFHTIPYRAQDALSSLYYLRTRDDIKPGSSISIDVFDGGKAWTVEVKVLGRERLHTLLGEVDTVKVVTFPKYEGVFLHKGEIMIWLTDDARRVPVLMQSKISIGSIVATLTEMKGGDDRR